MPKNILYPLRVLHGRLHDNKLEKNKAEECRKRILDTDMATLMFVLTPDHGNLGDHAIAQATELLLEELNVKYIEITTKELMRLEKFGMLNAMDGHPILVNGGGNLGTLWPNVERIFRAVIKANRKSSIICLPNTIYYENSTEGKLELEASKRIYNAHPRLKLCAREMTSYNFMKPIYNDVVLVPDMSLSLNECRDVTERSGCLLCLRSDIEKTRSEAEEGIVREQAELLFGDRVTDTDMYIGRDVPAEKRNSELEIKYDEFRHAELVITDRLHGMLFCAITGTPCIVINSKSPKVRGCYGWLEDSEYIRFAASAEEISELYNSIPKKHFTLSGEKYADYFDGLKKYIIEAVSE